MRITGGRLRGRRLASPRGMDIRPSSDKVREAVFNLIGHDLDGLVIADLFAGTGALGIEALSRGARIAFFLDSSDVALGLIRKNLILCGVEGSGIQLKWDLRKGIPRSGPLFSASLDLVFLDPPYFSGLLPGVLERLSESELPALGCRAVVETAKREIPPETSGRLCRITTRSYGDTRISIYSSGG